MQNAALFSAVGAYFFARRSLALGSLNFAYGLGGFVGPLAGAKMAATGTGRCRSSSMDRSACVLRRLIAVVIRKAFTEQQEVAGDMDRPLDVAHVPPRLYNRNTVLLGVTAVVVGMSMYGYIGLYPTFLVSQLHWSSGQAALAASMFGLGALLGIPAGWLGDRVDQHVVMIVSLLLGALRGLPAFQRAHRCHRAVRAVLLPRARSPVASCSSTSTRRCSALSGRA